MLKHILAHTETLVVEDYEVVTVEEKQLVIFNDDVNTFDHVIQALIDICHHTPEQAEQCAWITHFKGKCTVKHGEFLELLPMRTGICGRGISAEILYGHALSFQTCRRSRQ